MGDFKQTSSIKSIKHRTLAALRGGKDAGEDRESGARLQRMINKFGDYNSFVHATKKELNGLFTYLEKLDVQAEKCTKLFSAEWARLEDIRTKSKENSGTESTDDMRSVMPLMGLENQLQLLRVAAKVC
eukprot:1185438-Prorocentrum_minimum.AAC.7